MIEVEKLYELLKSIQSLFGIIGVVMVLFLIVIGLLLWFYLRTFIKGYAKSFFKQGLAKFQSELLQGIGEKLIIQKSELEKEILGLKNEFEKEFNEIQNELEFLTNQKSILINQKREALINYYSSYINWLSTISGANMGSIYTQYPDLWENELKKIEISNFKHKNAEGFLELFFEDEELNILKGKLGLITLRYQHSIEKQIAFERHYSNKMKIIEGREIDAMHKIKSMNDIFKEYEIQKRSYLDEQLEIYKELMVHKESIRINISEKISSLSKE